MFNIINWYKTNRKLYRPELQFTLNQKTRNQGPWKNQPNKQYGTFSI